MSPSPYQRFLQFLVCIDIFTNFVVSAKTPKLEHFINLFSLCSVKLVNYQNIDLAYTSPVSIYFEKSFRIEKDVPTGNQNCLALFYILPGKVVRKTGPKGHEIEDDRYNYYRRRVFSSEIRYDILVDGDRYSQRRRQDWWMEYKDLYLGGKPSHGLILNSMTLGYYGFALENRLEIVNKLQIAKGLVVGTFYLESAIETGTLMHLASLIETVNDLRKNRDVPWHISGISPKEPTFRKNLILARYAVGGNNVSIVGGYRHIGPTIRFNVDGDMEKNLFMIDKVVNEYGFLTYHRENKPEPEQRRKSIWEVTADLVSIYPARVYIGMGVAYFLVPIILLGHVYHYLLKSKIQTEYWITWHPFCWGIRALIRQPGDRIYNAKRFGFMTWLAYPLSLMSIILSHCFDRNILRAISFVAIYSGFGHEYIRSPNDLYESGLTMLTPWDVSQEKEIPGLLQENTTLFYMDTVENIMMIKDKLLSPYDLVRIGTFWGQREKYNVGWKVTCWGDDNFLRRLKIIEGESQIKQKVHQKPTIRSIWPEFAYVTTLSMSSYIHYVFLAGLVAFLACFVVWILEHILGMSVPRRKVVKKVEKCKKNVDGKNVWAKFDTEMIADAMMFAKEEEEKRKASVQVMTVRSPPLGKSEEDICVKLDLEEKVVIEELMKEDADTRSEFDGSISGSEVEEEEKENHF